MRALHVYERKTFKFVDSARSRDRHDFVATVKMTPAKCVREAEEYDDGGTYIVHARAPSGAPNLTRHLTTTLSHWGCSHEYDCCGCRLTRASVQKISARDYVIKLDHSFNY